MARSNSVMSVERKWEFLRESADRLVKAFRSGQNPTEKQLNNVETAVWGVTVQKQCGHREIEECDCEEQ